MGNVTYIYPLCQIQAFVANSSSLCLNTFSLCLTFFLFYTVVVNNQYRKLKSLYSKLIIIFLVLCFLVSIPFFVFIFPVPVPNSSRYAELYGKSSKLWCDFANTPNHYINQTDDASMSSFISQSSPKLLMTSTISTMGEFSRKNATVADPVETYWAIFFEIGFFYVPNTLILFGYVSYFIT